MSARRPRESNPNRPVIDRLRMPGRRSGLRGAGKRGLGSLFAAMQRAGVDLLPRHFYSSIPDIAHLRSTRRWRHPRTMVGVRGSNLAEQQAFLISLFSDEIRQTLIQNDHYAEACATNGAVGYGKIEAEVLYAFVRTRRPRKVIQVGAGVSTAIMLRAARDAGYRVDIEAVDPYPTDYLRGADITLIERDAQDIPWDRLTSLSDGDLLFIDSTHTVKVDSEVNLLILEILPRLPRGVWVHFHDAYLPYDYQRDILKPPLFFWAESTLVHAFLVGNAYFRIGMSLSMLHYASAPLLTELFPGYRPELGEHGIGAGSPHGDFPSSLFLIKDH